MPSNTATAEYMRSYRLTHPERYEKDKTENNERYKNKYHNDPDYRLKILEYKKKRYALLKELKANTKI